MFSLACGDFAYLLPLSENGQFLFPPGHKTPPVFLPREAGRKPHRPRFPRQPHQQVLHTTLCEQKCVPEGGFFGPSVLSGSWYSPHKNSAIPRPAKTQVGGIGQPIPSADLCRLFAYMGAYCIAHVKRSNLLLPCDRMDMILFEKLKAFFEERAETQLAQEQHKLERLENRKKFLE